ncbi:DUF5996 family protein [Actinocorallia aurea]
MSVWPSLPLAEFEPTKNTLLLWTQVVGKVRIARTPLVNHWWNAPLYLTPRGFTTSLIPGAPGRSFAIDFDFLAGSLDIAATDGTGRRMALAEQRTVEEFHARLMELLDELGLHTEIWPVPVELEGSIPFPEDDAPRSYDPDQALRFWRLLVEAERVFTVFRARFVGKNSPVHLFWGALDLATTRFSGRTAPPHPGGAPNCGPHVMHEAYSHEVSSCGYWPGGEGEGFFYSYAYPEPSGYREMPAGVPEAHYDAALGEFVLPYEAVRTAADPDAKLLAFLQATYEAAAGGAGWPRAELER